MTGILDAPCVFCAYAGSGYWQTDTHDTECPWHKVGGKTVRVELVRDVVRGQWVQLHRTVEEPR